MSFDQHPYEREDEEIRKEFSKKDAAIAMMTEQAASFRDMAEKQGFEIMRLNSLLATIFESRSKAEDDSDKAYAEIKRLKQLAKRLACGWDMERVYEFGGGLTFDEIDWRHWDMVKDPEVIALFELPESWQADRAV